MEKHKETHYAVRKQYKCEECDKSFLCRSGRSRHMKQRHSQNQIKMYECDLCDKTLSSSTGLIYHLESFHQGRRYTCDVCEKSFMTKKSYLLHAMNPKSHAEKIKITYRCHICDKSFSQGFDLKKHIASIHSDSHIRFTCEGCGKRFKYKRG